MELSLTEVRRLVLSAQQFGRRPAKATAGDVRDLASKIHCFRIDSVNVLARAHYFPAFSRLGPYPMDALDKLTYSRRELFEFSGRGACLMPVELYPLLRHRMEAARAVPPWTPGRESSDTGYVETVYDEVAERGPLTVRELSDPGRTRGKWWGWNTGKIALEHLLNSGRVAVAERRGFERAYDIVERVIPRQILELSAPDAVTAQKQLLCLAAQAQGVALANALTDYFALGWDTTGAGSGRAKRKAQDRLVAELVEEGRLVRVSVESWSRPAYMHAEARVPPTIDVRALVGPFDSVLWGSLPMLCGFEQFLGQQLYVPASKRMFGYYVLPFLLEDAFVARCDLKADRERKVLMVQSAHLEPGEDPGLVVPELAVELREMQEWLGLVRIEVADRGDLAQRLREALQESAGARGRSSRRGLLPQGEGAHRRHTPFREATPKPRRRSAGSAL